MPSPLAALARPIRSVLDRARDAFGSPRAETVAGATPVVTIGTTVGILALGGVFDATVDERVTVDNPDRPPESACEAYGDDPGTAFGEQCDRPERTGVDAGEELRDAASGHVHYGRIGVRLWWAAVALHVGARAAGGSGSAGDAFVIAGRALAAELVRLVTGLAGIWYALSNAAISGSTGEAVVDAGPARAPAPADSGVFKPPAPPLSV